MKYLKSLYLVMGLFVIIPAVQAEVKIKSTKEIKQDLKKAEKKIKEGVDTAVEKTKGGIQSVKGLDRFRKNNDQFNNRVKDLNGYLDTFNNPKTTIGDKINLLSQIILSLSQIVDDPVKGMLHGVADIVKVANKDIAKNLNTIADEDMAKISATLVGVSNDTKSMYQKISKTNFVKLKIGGKAVAAMKPYNPDATTGIAPNLKKITEGGAKVSKIANSLKSSALTLDQKLSLTLQMLSAIEEILKGPVPDMVAAVGMMFRLPKNTTTTSTDEAQAIAGEVGKGGRPETVVAAGLMAVLIKLNVLKPLSDQLSSLDNNLIKLARNLYTMGYVIEDLSASLNTPVDASKNMEELKKNITSLNGLISSFNNPSTSVANQISLMNQMTDLLSVTLKTPVTNIVNDSVKIIKIEDPAMAQQLETFATTNIVAINNAVVMVSSNIKKALPNVSGMKVLQSPIARTTKNIELYQPKIQNNADSMKTITENLRTINEKMAQLDVLNASFSKKDITLGDQLSLIVQMCNMLAELLRQPLPGIFTAVATVSKAVDVKLEAVLRDFANNLYLMSYTISDLAVTLDSLQPMIKLAA